MADKHVYTFPEGTTLIYYQQNYNKCTDVNVGFKIPRINVPDETETVGIYKNKLVFYMTPDGRVRVPIIKPGLPHFIEHMFYSSLPDMKVNDIFDELTRTNTIFNACTTQDYVKNEFNCPSKFVDRIFDLQSRLMFRTEYDADDLRREKRPVYQELEMYKDAPSGPSLEDVLTSTYDSLTAEEILGIDKKVIDTYTDEQMLKFCNAYFTKENMVITCVSDLPFDQIKDLCQKNFVDKAPSVKETKIETNHVEYDFFEDIEEFYPDATQKTATIEFYLKGSSDTEQNDLYSNIENFIFNNLNGRLNQLLRAKYGLTYTAHFGTINCSKVNVKHFSITTTPKNVKKCITCLTFILSDLIKNGIKDSEFEGFKEMWENRRERKSSLKFNNAHSLFNKFIYNKPVFVGNFFEKTKKITKEDINNYINEIYGKSKLGMFISGNFDMLEIEPLRKIISKYRPHDKYIDKNLFENVSEAELLTYIIEENRKQKPTYSDFDFVIKDVPKVETATEQKQETEEKQSSDKQVEEETKEKETKTKKNTKKEKTSENKVFATEVELELK